MPAASRSAAPDDLLRKYAMPAAVVAMFVVLGALGGFLFTLLAPKHYTGSARVLVQATGFDITSQANTRTPNGAINLDTEAQLVTSTDVRAQAARTYRPFAHVSRTRLEDDVTVSVPANTSVLQIDYVSGTKAGARRGADALAAGYLAARRNAAQAQLTTQIKAAQTAVDSLGAQLQKLIAQDLTLAAKSASKFYVGEQIGVVKNRLVAQSHQLVGYNAISVTPGRLVNPAATPGAPSSPSLLVDLVSGAAIGLLVGLLVVWLRRRFRRTVRTRAHIGATTDVACLAVLPRAAVAGASGDEQYRRLGLVATAAARGARRMVFTSPAASASVGTVADGVAVALRRAGHAVALLRVNTASTLATPSAAATRARGIEVTAVPSAEAISTRRGESVDDALERVRADNDLLIIDCPAAAERADAQAVAAGADAVVIVVEAGTRARALRAAVHSLDEVGAPILGVVLVQKTGRRKRSAAHPEESTQDHGETSDDDDFSDIDIDISDDVEAPDDALFFNDSTDDDIPSDGSDDAPATNTAVPPDVDPQTESDVDAITTQPDAVGDPVTHPRRSATGPGKKSGRSAAHQSGRSRKR